MQPSESLRLRMQPALTRALDFAAAQAQNILDRYPGYAPMYTVDGRWNREAERWTHWCEGFFPGVLWLVYKHTGDERWRGPAERLSRALEPRRHDRTVHDLGFLFLSTYLRWWHLDRDEALRGVLIEAGRTLALRRQKGGYLASFLGPHSLFIDVMMNVGVVFWAARAAGDGRLFNVARGHCEVTLRTLVRPDGGTAHEGLFDPETGAFLRQSTQQGYRPESTWSRGLSWSLYGFTSAYRFCREPAFLDAARRNAEYYLARREAGPVPPWDFDAPPGDPPLLDSSAGAILASGLFDLAEVVAEAELAECYRVAALEILQALCGPDFLAEGRPGWEGVLMGGVYHYPKGLAVGESVAWGEHFFVEALVKAVAGRSPAAW